MWWRAFFHIACKTLESGRGAGSGSECSARTCTGERDIRGLHWYCTVGYQK